MMVKSRGPVWHKKQKETGIMPKNLRGVDREGTWSYSKSDKWIYGHGTFCMTAHEVPVVGMFIYMRNSANEAKLMGRKVRLFSGHIKNVCMDSKADDMDLEFSLRQFSKINLITSPRKGMNKSEKRKYFIKKMKNKTYREIYKKRSITVEPAQGMMADIFSLERCWMRGEENNRWVFAAMGVAVQMAQLNAWREGRSVWKIKDEVLGL
jgi:hypothetical protein